ARSGVVHRHVALTPRPSPRSADNPLTFFRFGCCTRARLTLHFSEPVGLPQRQKAGRASLRWTLSESLRQRHGSAGSSKEKPIRAASPEKKSRYMDALLSAIKPRRQAGRDTGNPQNLADFLRKKLQRAPSGFCGSCREFRSSRV